MLQDDQISPEDGEPAPIATATPAAQGRVNASTIRIAKDPSLSPPYHFSCNLDGALYWYNFGYNVMPVLPGLKKPASKHDSWLSALTEEALRAHWAAHPDHEVGAILREGQLLIDADTPEALAALEEIERRFSVQPSLIVKTKRGAHHHYRLEQGVFAKTDSHSTTTYPERVDVRAMNNSILLTPSTNKCVQKLEASTHDAMTAVGQDFVDAVFQHNGREAPRPPVDAPADKVSVPTDLSVLQGLLNYIDPDCGYQDWLHVLMAIYHETGGSDEGLELANAWSRKGRSYPGRKDIEAKWRSFRGDVSNPITIGTLIARARDGGADIASNMAEDFPLCETEVVSAPERPSVKASPLARFSLIGQTEKYEAMAQEATPLLGEVCLRGEATVWYAKPNAGKTLLFLHLAIEAIQQGRLAGSDLYFINADDNSLGIAAKLAILDEFRAHTLVPGQKGFKSGDLKELLLEAARTGTAQGTVVVIDTLKKFTDLMNKKQASDFASVCRRYVAAGGTLLGLAHVNKKRSEDGKAVYAGTSDILDDFDAGYILDEAGPSEDQTEKVVVFRQEKARGGGAQTVAYAYANEGQLSYGERLASVRLVDPTEMDGIRRVEQERSDADLIVLAKACIQDGHNTKIVLRDALAARANVSQRQAHRLIERYTGDDPLKAHWSFVRKAKGAKVFALHQPSPAEEAEAA